MDIEGAKKIKGTKIMLYEAHGQWNQKFQLLLNEDGSVTFENGGLAMDVQDGAAKNGTQIRVWERNGSNAQKFYLTCVGNDCYEIHSAINQNFCVDVNGGKNENNTKIQLWEKNGSKAQLFRFVE